jgi:hypothetical protein
VVAGWSQLRDLAALDRALTVTVGYDSRGKRITRKASAKTKTEAKDKLKEMVRDLDDGLPIPANGYTVADAVNAWLHYGLRGRDAGTIGKYICLARTHIIESVGAKWLFEVNRGRVAVRLPEVIVSV